MANALEAKKAKVAQIKELITSAKSVVLVDYKGLTVAQDTEMRKDLRDAGVIYKVLKNTLTSRAFEELGVKGLENMLEGPTAVAFSQNDEVSAARVVRQSIEKFKKMAFKGGYMDGKVMTVEEVKALSYIPSREQLIANLLGVLTAPMRKLAIVLDQAAKQKA
ncbi:MAG TPA: 50S ribosomal protein L10 [Clostridiales bacterium]|nr:50S ribosomal protein L10 [Clostridiales bacterium]